MAGMAHAGLAFGVLRQGLEDGFFHGRQADHFAADLDEALEPPGEGQITCRIEEAEIAGDIPVAAIVLMKDTV